MSRTCTILLGLLLLWPAPAPAAGAVIHVVPAADGGDDSGGDGSAALPYATLTHAVSQAAPGDEIILSAGEWFETAAVIVDMNLTITGAGAGKTVLDGSYAGPGTENEAHRVLIIGNGSSACTVTISGLTVQHGYTMAKADHPLGLDDDGAGIFVRPSASLAMENCRIADNHATDDGGGIQAQGTSLTMTDCLVSGNTATKDSGTASGAGVHGDQGDLTLDGCVFSENSISVPSGGSAPGGGVRYNAGGTFTATNCTFRNNTLHSTSTGGDADTLGGGLWVAATTALIRDCTFFGNEISCSGARALGAGIYVTDIWPGSTCDMVNCTVSGNRVLDTEPAATFGGGGIHAEGASLTLNLDSCTIADNTTPGEGGGIRAETAGLTLSLTNTMVADNTADTNGNDISTDGSATLTSGGHNLVRRTDGWSWNTTGANDLTGTDPLLLPLADNGGATRTRALENASPALNAGDTTLARDQRGVSRPYGGGCDIGAWEGTTEITVSTDSLDFADTQVTSASSMTVTVTAGAYECIINKITTTGDSAFSTQAAGPLTLAAGESTDIQVDFTPDSEGAKTGTLVITSQDPLDSDTLVSLAGTATARSTAPGSSPSPGPDDGQDDGQDGAAPAGGGGGGGGGCTAGGTSSLWLALLVPALSALRRGRGR